jgi:hypothetical protein
MRKGQGRSNYNGMVILVALLAVLLPELKAVALTISRPRESMPDSARLRDSADVRFDADAQICRRCRTRRHYHGGPRESDSSGMGDHPRRLDFAGPQKL